MRIEEIEFMPTSGLDDAGRVFRWKDDIYRGIYPAYAKLYREIFGGGIGENLIKSGVIPTEITDYQLEGFKLILKHKTIPFISYPVEWSSAMLKDAALLTCDIQSKLLRNGYILKDGHPYNILFDGCKAQFIDVGSISYKSPSAGYHFQKELRNDFVFPLLLKYAGLSEIADATHLAYLGLQDKLVNINFLFFRMLLFRIPLQRWLYHLKQPSVINKVWSLSPIEGMLRLRKEIEYIPANSFKKRDCNHFEDFLTSKANDGLSAKLSALKRVVNELKPRSILNLYSNKGLYSSITAESGATAIDCDTDEDNVNLQYCRGKKKSCNVLSIKLDIGNPTLSYGPWGLCGPSQERFKCDLVTLLDIMPKIIIDRHSTFTEISFYLHSFSRKWVLVEFIGYNEISSKYRERFKKAEYSLQAFKVALEKQFQYVKVICQVGTERWLVLCSRKGSSEHLETERSII